MHGRKQLEREITIDAPVSTVWEVLSDARLLPEWVPAVDEVVACSVDGETVGAVRQCNAAQCVLWTHQRHGGSATVPIGRRRPPRRPEDTLGSTTRCAEGPALCTIGDTTNDSLTARCISRSGTSWSRRFGHSGRVHRQRLRRDPRSNRCGDPQRAAARRWRHRRRASRLSRNGTASRGRCTWRAATMDGIGDR